MNRWDYKTTLFDKFTFLISKKNKYENILEKENHFIPTIQYGLFPGLLVTTAPYHPLYKKKKLYRLAWATSLLGLPLVQYNRLIKRNQTDKAEIEKIYSKILNVKKTISVSNKEIY
jgi:hypothetical protein